MRQKTEGDGNEETWISPETFDLRPRNVAPENLLKTLALRMERVRKPMT